MNKRRLSCVSLLLIAFVLLVLGILMVVSYAPSLAAQTYGPPSPRLTGWQKLDVALQLIWNAGDIMSPVDPSGAEVVFAVDQGESVNSIAARLQQAGLIREAGTFRLYLVWSGMDTSVQSGSYRLSPAQTGLEIAAALQDPLPSDAKLGILPGWRMEEIAAALPSSGLEITTSDFLSAAAHPVMVTTILPPGATAEGFLTPGQYTLPRTTTADQLVSALISSATTRLTPELTQGFDRHGLDVYQAVILASIVEREAIVEEEMPVIASVFYNRLASGMKLESDPTVQYAIGYNAAFGTWWTNPLTLADLHFTSPYNTYVYAGLPPAPIANPGSAALQAVAFPAETPYYYFMARCDGSGYHNFSTTFEEHSRNLCP